MNQPLDLNTPTSITLPFGAWNNVITLLGKRPWEEVSQLILAIQQQLQAQLDQPRSGNVMPWPQTQTKDPSA